MKIVKHDTKVPKFALVMRLVKHEGRDYKDAAIKSYFLKVPFGVQQVPISYWQKSKWKRGFTSCDFTNQEDAERFFNDVRKLTDQQLQKKYPRLWVPKELWMSFKSTDKPG